MGFVLDKKDKKTQQQDLEQKKSESHRRLPLSQSSYKQIGKENSRIEAESKYLRTIPKKKLT